MSHIRRFHSITYLILAFMRIVWRANVDSNVSFAQVTEALLFSFHFKLAEHKDKCDIVLEDHLEEVSGCLLCWSLCSDKELKLLTRVQIACVDVVVKLRI